MTFTSSLVCFTYSNDSRSFQRRTPTRRRGRRTCVRTISAKRASHVNNGSCELRTRIEVPIAGAAEVEGEGENPFGGGARTVFPVTTGDDGGDNSVEGVRGVYAYGGGSCWDAGENVSMGIKGTFDSCSWTTPIVM